MSDEERFFEHPAERFFLSQTYRLLKLRPRHIQFFRILLEACFGASWGCSSPTNQFPITHSCHDEVSDSVASDHIL